MGRRLLKMCCELDADGSGDLSLQELMDGLTTNEEFRITLADMGIDKEDMETVFHIMDEDHSGYVDYKEFVRHIHKMKTSDEQTMLNFIRYHVTSILGYVMDQKHNHQPTVPQPVPMVPFS